MMDSGADYNFNLVFGHLAFIGGAHFYTSATPVLFLTLERCWILIAVPTSPLARWQKPVQTAIFHASLIVFAVACVLLFLVYYNIWQFGARFGDPVMIVLKLGA